MKHSLAIHTGMREPLTLEIIVDPGRSAIIELQENVTLNTLHTCILIAHLPYSEHISRTPFAKAITWLTEYATFLVDAGTSHTRPAIHQTERSSTHAAASGTFRRQNQGEEIRP